MMIGHRIHQDQIRLMADLMKTLYSQKKTEPEQNPGAARRSETRTSILWHVQRSVKSDRNCKKPPDYAGLHDGSAKKCGVFTQFLPKRYSPG